MVVSIILNIASLLTILVGILVLAFPKFLRVAVGLYLIIIGVLGLLSANGVLLSPF